MSCRSLLVWRQTPGALRACPWLHTTDSKSISVGGVILDAMVSRHLLTQSISTLPKYAEHKDCPKHWAIQLTLVTASEHLVSCHGTRCVAVVLTRTSAAIGIVKIAQSSP
ncbi:hypothetical protein RRG08_040771 [Elysia crispata]|uniref:Uncharacterized protein n=1 Tax=Elysia crispata TaxID=231223 RepID=A0AAE1BDG4_9GAST|nr:hypothetical protein RRG08_040771 [Elysia crispata]